jgi:hypothetical protein
MTPHDHRVFVAGCFRCELGRDEVEDVTNGRCGIDTCPCNDGDPCNYEDHGDTKAWAHPSTLETELPTDEKQP